MTGTAYKVEVDDREVLAELHRLIDAGESLDEPLRDIGEALLHSTLERWSREEAPDGAPWAPLSDRYARRKARRRPNAGLLVYDDELRGTLRYQVEGDELALGTDRPYGRIHQLGGLPGMAPGPAAIPARPYLGFSDDDRREILEIFRDHLLGRPAR